MRSLQLFAAVALSTVALATLAACGPGGLTLDQKQKDQAELGARDFFERAAGSFISCSARDSDGDGYVTCEGTVAGSSGMPESVALLCAYNERGCKRK